MRFTVTLDDDLVASAARFTGISVPETLVEVALRTLVEREASSRLAALGGTEPNLEAPPRRPIGA